MGARVMRVVVALTATALVHAAGPDGNLWFTSMNNARVGRITTSGAITTFGDPAGNVDLPRGITSGPGTDMWFASSNSDRIGRIATTGPAPRPAPTPAQPVAVPPRFTG
jgi:streptogramin lyase